MKNVRKIIAAYGGISKFRHVRIELPNYMPLVIERIGDGPDGFPLFSVTHYYEQNGDLMRDPEVTLELFTDPWGRDDFVPCSFEQSNLGIYQVCRYADESGQVRIAPRLQRDIAIFARMWDRNLKDQGFVSAAIASAARLTT